MKVITAENGSTSIKMSKSEWASIGEQHGWVKEAQLSGSMEGMNAFLDFSIPNLKGIISNYLVNPASIGMAENHAQKITQQVNDLIASLERFRR